jgi:hypothetical protein
VRLGLSDVVSTDTLESQLTKLTGLMERIADRLEALESRGPESPE